MRRAPLLLTCVLAAACGDTILTTTPKADDTAPTVVPEPDIQVSPSNLDFGGSPPGCTSEAKPVTVTNTGEADLTLSEVRLRGPDWTAYAVQGATTLAPGEAVTLSLTFGPKDFVAYADARLEVISDDPDTPTATVALAGEGSSEGEIDEVFLQDATDQVDVLIAIDQSGSMSDELDALGSTFNAFINRFVALGLDYHIAVMGIDPDCPYFVGPVISNATADPVAEFVRQTDLEICDDNEATFSATQKALSPPAIGDQNKGFLRDDATLAVVAFSDEWEQSGLSFTARQYVDWLESLKAPNGAARTSFSGLFGPEPGLGTITCLFQAFGNAKYYQAARQSGGVDGNICNAKIGPFLNHLALVASGLHRSFPLGHVPNATAPGDLVVEVEGVEVAPGATDGWVYDGGENAIVFDGDAVPRPGEEVVVRYRYDAVCD